MRKIFYLSFTFSALFLSSCATEAKEKNEDIKLETISYGTYDVNVNKAVTVSEISSKMEKDKSEQEFTFKADISEVCSNAGCWINVKKPDGTPLMVRFKDHFTIPINTPIGTEAYLHGTAYWDTIPVDMLQHFAEDAGKSEEEIAKITAPKYELSFEADGIKIVKAKTK